ncbi:MAG: hypothetical protein KKH98_15245 [Spirochaetes bacterium]|nr:hypothetical protein [Spirochaetota bacterium]
MKKTKQYQKGKHIYIKSGKNKEIITVRENKKEEIEFDKNCEEIYIDQFKFETSKNSFKFFFGKQIMGTPNIKLKRVIRMNYKTAKRFFKILKDLFKKDQ